MLYKLKSSGMAQVAEEEQNDRAKYSTLAIIFNTWKF
jgi:hypothetical protein